MTQDNTTLKNSICKECDKELTEEDIEYQQHRRRGYCMVCNKKYAKTSKNKKRVKVLDSVHTGDNLKVMKFVENESIDLIYLDPPYYEYEDYYA